MGDVYSHFQVTRVMFMVKVARHVGDVYGHRPNVNIVLHSAKFKDPKMLQTFKCLSRDERSQWDIKT